MDRMWYIYSVGYIKMKIKNSDAFYNIDIICGKQNPGVIIYAFYELVQSK